MGWGEFPIFTSYDTLNLDQLPLGQINFECVILDEAQNIKSNISSRSHAIRAMQARFPLAMTGTPVENSLEELWPIMDFVEPGVLGALSEFKKHYIKEQDYEGLKNSSRKSKTSNCTANCSDILSKWNRYFRESNLNFSSV